MNCLKEPTICIY